MSEATKAFEPALDRDMKLGTESPGPQMYSASQNTIGNANPINARIKATKQFSISKAKRDFGIKAGEGADFGKYNITIGEMSKEKNKRAAGAAWGKAIRKLKHDISE